MVIKYTLTEAEIKEALMRYVINKTEDKIKNLKVVLVFHDCGEGDTPFHFSAEVEASL